MGRGGCEGAGEDGNMAGWRGGEGGDAADKRVDGSGVRVDGDG